MFYSKRSYTKQIIVRRGSVILDALGVNKNNRMCHRKIHQSYVEKLRGRWNSSVLRGDRKVDSDGVPMMGADNEFQTRGVATGKTRSPQCVGFSCIG